MKKILKARIIPLVLTVATVCSVALSILIVPATTIDTNQATCVSIPWDYITKCGNQVSSGNDNACQAYAFTYCRIILDNSSHMWTEYRSNGQRACHPSVAGYKCNGNHQHVNHTASNGTDWWQEYKSPSGQSYYWEETRTVPAGYETQYRYRDKIN